MLELVQWWLFSHVLAVFSLAVAAQQQLSVWPDGGPGFSPVVAVQFAQWWPVLSLVRGVVCPIWQPHAFTLVVALSGLVMA